MSDLQVYHKEIDSVYKNAYLLDNVEELINFLASNNFEGVNYVDSKIAQDLSNLTPADEVKICSLLDMLLKVNETAGIFDLSDPNALFDMTFPVLEQLFKIIADENYNLLVLAKVLQTFSRFFSNSTILHLIHQTQTFEGSIQILGRKLPLIGDYICQLQLCECLFILSSTSKIWTRIWFQDPKIRSTFLNIDGSNFEEDARKVLNVVNRMEDNQRVFSYPVKTIMFGTTKLKKPSEEFWVDFNYDTESITFFFVYDDETFWETARIRHFNVNRYMFKDNKKGSTQELIITLNCPCYQIVDDVSENPVTESNILTIVFHSVQKIKDHVEKVFGSRCFDSSQNKDSPACSNVVSIHKYMESDCTEFDQKTKHIGKRKVSVWENVMDLETNEAEESLSISNKRKASSVIHLQSHKKISTSVEGIEIANNVDDDDFIPGSVRKTDVKPIFKKSSISCMNIVAVEESYISVEQINADKLEKCTNASFDFLKHVAIDPPTPTTQKFVSEDKKTSLQEGLSVSSPNMKLDDYRCSATEKEISVNLELDESTLKLTNEISNASNIASTSKEKSFHFEKPGGDSKNTHVGVENMKNLKVGLESKNHPHISQVDGSSSNKKSSQLLQHLSVPNDPFSHSDMTDTAICTKKKKNKKKKVKTRDVNDVRRKSVEEIFDSHSDNNIDQKEVVNFEKEDKPVFKATTLNSKENSVAHCEKKKQMEISSPEFFSCPKTEENVKSNAKIDDLTLSRKNNSSKVTPKSFKKRINLFDLDRVPVYDSAPKSEKIRKRSILKTNYVANQIQKKNLSMQDDDDDFVIPRMKTRSYLKNNATPNVRAEKRKIPDPKNLTLEKKEHLISEDLNTRRSALWARKKSKAMLDFESLADDEQNFDIQCQPQSSPPKFSISSGKGPTPSKKHRSIFHTDTETISSGHSWLKKKRKLFEPPKRKYSDRKKAKKAVSKNQADEGKEDTAYNLNNSTRYELDQKKSLAKYKGNDETNKSNYRNWSDIEKNELFVEKVPSRSCLSKKFSRSRLSADSNVSVEHPVESAVLEHEDVDFEQNIEVNENSHMKTMLKDSLTMNISRDMASEMNRENKNPSDLTRMKSKDYLLSRIREENKFLQTPAGEKNAAVVSQMEKIKENEKTLPLKVTPGHQLDSEVEISKIPTESSLKEFDIACDESKGKKMHLKYFLNSLTETSDLAENESGSDYTNSSKKRKSEYFSASKKRKKLKIDRKQKESKVLKQEVLQARSGPENSAQVLNYNGKISTKPNVNVEKDRILENFEVPVDDTVTFYLSDENKSRNKEYKVSSLHQTGTKEKEKHHKSSMKFHSKKTEASTEESERNPHPDIHNLNTNILKRPSFSSSCSDLKKSKTEILLSTLSKYVNEYAKKLIATFQICSRDYYIQAAKMRNYMLHVFEHMSKTDEYLPTNDLKMMNCRFTRKKVEASLRKMAYLGQEYFEFEKKYRLRMKNKNRRAGSKFCYYLQCTYKNALNHLEKKVFSKLNKVHKNFIHDINLL